MLEAAFAQMATNVEPIVGISNYLGLTSEVKSSSHVAVTRQELRRGNKELMDAVVQNVAANVVLMFTTWLPEAKSAHRSPE